MSDQEYGIDKVHALLSNTSIELSSIFWDVPRAIQLREPDDGGWSPLKLLVHMRQEAEIYAGRTKRIMKNEAEKLIKLKDYDEKRLLAKVRLEDESAKGNINTFMRARSELLNQVSFIEKEEWNTKRCIHERDGDLTLLEMLIPLAKREETYLNILRELLADYL